MFPGSRHFIRPHSKYSPERRVHCHLPAMFRPWRQRPRSSPTPYRNKTVVIVRFPVMGQQTRRQGLWDEWQQTLHTVELLLYWAAEAHEVVRC
jgi:hypothetical protein